MEVMERLVYLGAPVAVGPVVTALGSIAIIQTWLSTLQQPSKLEKQEREAW